MTFSKLDSAKGFTVPIVTVKGLNGTVSTVLVSVTSAKHVVRALMI
ncbi:hypothetical protein [Desulfosporosinus sp. OT]|nr:hypothetical protein [Desulfosporosinus sp. OT]EGW41094.1 putative ISH4 transposase domain protein [Desulfosporosinus sp. OT]